MKITARWSRCRNWLALLSLLSVSGAVASFDQVGRIEGALGMFGRSLDVERIVSPQTAAQAARATAKGWRDEAHPSVREDPRSGKVLEVVQPPWWIVSRYRGESLETIQWKDRGMTGAEGVRSMMAVPMPGRCRCQCQCRWRGRGLPRRRKSPPPRVPSCAQRRGFHWFYWPKRRPMTGSKPRSIARIRKPASSTADG